MPHKTQAVRPALVGVEQKMTEVATTYSEDPSADSHLIALGCEMWHLCKKASGWFAASAGDYSVDRRTRGAVSQIDWARSRLADILAQRDIEIQDRTGQVWDIGDPVDVVNAPETAQSGVSTVSSTLEPVVLHQGKVVQRGKVTVNTTAG